MLCVVSLALLGRYRPFPTVVHIQLLFLKALSVSFDCAPRGRTFKVTWEAHLSEPFGVLVPTIIKPRLPKVQSLEALSGMTSGRDRVQGLTDRRGATWTQRPAFP